MISWGAVTGSGRSDGARCWLFFRSPADDGTFRARVGIWIFRRRPRLRLKRLFAARLFTCLAKLSPGGGGTVFVAGSHRLVQDLAHKESGERLHSADARKALIRTCPWMKALCAPDGTADRVRQFMESSASFDDVELRVVEMTGEAGDVLLTHPLLLHAPAKNCAPVPRLVLSSTIYRSGVQPSALYA